MNERELPSFLFSFSGFTGKNFRKKIEVPSEVVLVRSGSELDSRGGLLEVSQK